MRIAVFVQQALFRSETSASTVDLDGAAFENDWIIEDRNLQQRRDLFGDAFVLLVRFVLSAPTIEDPIVERSRIFLRYAGNESRPVVPHPDIDGGEFKQRHIGHGRT